MRTKIRTNEFNKKMRNNAMKQLADWALFVEARAKQLVPVDTGNLRSSIHTEINERKLSAKVGTNTKYATYVEFGTYASREPIAFDSHTIGMSPKPFLRPALDELIARIR